MLKISTMPIACIYIFINVHSLIYICIHAHAHILNKKNLVIYLLLTKFFVILTRVLLFLPLFLLLEKKNQNLNLF